MDIFEPIHFSQNLRLVTSEDPNQELYAKTLLEIGKGNHIINLLPIILIPK